MDPIAIALIGLAVLVLLLVVRVPVAVAMLAVGMGGYVALSGADPFPGEPPDSTIADAHVRPRLGVDPQSAAEAAADQAGAGVAARDATWRYGRH